MLARATVVDLLLPGIASGLNSFRSLRSRTKTYDFCISWKWGFLGLPASHIHLRVISLMRFCDLGWRCFLGLWLCPSWCPWSLCQGLQVRNMTELKYHNFLEGENSKLHSLIYSLVNQVGEVGAEPGTKGKQVLQRVKQDFTHIWNSNPCGVGVICSIQLHVVPPDIIREPSSSWLFRNVIIFHIYW